jgi:Calx-beta domain
MMANPISGSLGRNTSYANTATGLNDFTNEWLVAADNQSIDITGSTTSTFNSSGANLSLLNFSTATNQNLNNLALTTLNQPGNDTFGSVLGIGVADAFDGWYNDAGKIRAEINHNPNNGESQLLRFKWADNQSVTNAFIDLSSFAPIADEKFGTERGFVQAFKNGTPVSITGVRYLNENTVAATQTSIQNTTSGVIFTADKLNTGLGDYKLRVFGDFNELRFTALSYLEGTANTPRGTNGSGGTVLTDSSDYLVQQIKYVGTEDPITLQFSSPTFSVREDGTPIAQVTVTRTGSTLGTVSTTVNLTNGTATTPDDYTNTPIPVTFNPGQTTQVITIPIVDDNLIEGNETIQLSLSNPTGTSRVTLGSQSTATLTIVDNDNPGTLQFSNSQFVTLEDGTPVLAVTVTRTGGSNGAVSATVNLSDGTAVAPGDYNNTPITVNFADGDTAPKTVLIPIVDDNLVETTETVNLTLANPTGGATLGTQNTATLSIVDNDNAGNIQFGAPVFSVDENGTPIAQITVIRADGSAGAVGATINLTNGSAIAPDDYSNTPITVNFADGDVTPKVITVPIVNDTLVEGTETVNLALTSPTGGATIGTQGTATLNIVDNDTPGTLQFSNPEYVVNEDGTTVLAVTVTRTGGSAGTVGATVNLADGTAVAPGDYNNAPITVNFADGDTAPKIVTIPIVDDALVENEETVNLTLTNPTGGVNIGTQNNATLTILDNDVPVLPLKPVVFVGALDPTAGEPGRAEGNGTFQFARTGDISQALTVRYTVTGTATAGSDYAPLSGIVNFAAGESVAAPVDVIPFFDGRNEATESVIVKVAEDVTYQVGSADTAVVQLLDNDQLRGTPASTGLVLRYDSSGLFQDSYNRITDAVAVANDNDIIVAQAGTYSEPATITINRPLTLRGPNAGVSPGNAGMVSPAVVQTTAGQPIFTINSGVNNVTIEGLTIQMGGDNAIRLQGPSDNLVIRQNAFTGNGPNNGGVIFLDTGANPSAGAVSVIDNLIRDVVTAGTDTTSGIQAFQFNQVRITDNTIANLPGPGVVADSIGDPASVINSNNLSNIGEQGIQLAGGSARIENNDITNANTIGDINRGGIRLRDSGFFGGPTLGTVDVLSNVITNSYNGVAIRNGTNITGSVRVNHNNLIGNSNAGFYHNGTGAVDARNNWWDDINGPVVNGTGSNAIAGPSAASVTANPFSTTVL